MAVARSARQISEEWMHSVRRAVVAGIIFLLAISMGPTWAAPVDVSEPGELEDSYFRPEAFDEPEELGSEGPQITRVPDGAEPIEIASASSGVKPRARARARIQPLDLSASQAMYACDGYGKLPRFNPVEQVAKDQYAFDIFPAVTVGDGKGNIDWTLDPYKDLGWKLWFSSLRWLGADIEAARGGDEAAFTKAETIILDWAKDHGTDWSRNTDHMEANHHRMNVLICFREVVMQRHGGQLPTQYEWLTNLLDLHATHNLGRWSGANNHGSMENRVLLGYGCISRRRDLQQAALERIGKAFTTQVDAEGLSNEAAPHYALFNYQLFTSMRALMDRCGYVSAQMDARLEKMGESLAYMSNNLGLYWEYGNSNVYRAPALGSRFMRFAGTNGKEGRVPPRRIKAYSNGPVFGRSGWGKPGAGFTNQPSWMIRTGSGREVKAHEGDRLEFLYTARGRNIIVDTGFAGVTTSKWHAASIADTAHSTIAVSNMALSKTPARMTRKEWRSDGRGDFTEASQRLANGGSRTRGVFVASDPDVAVVLDRTVLKDGKPHVVQTLWNLPPDQTTTVRGRSVVESQVNGGSSTKTMLYYVPFWGSRTPQRGETARLRGQDGKTPRGFYFPRTFKPVANDQVIFGRGGSKVGTLSIIVPTRKNAKVGYSTSRYRDGATKLTITSGSQRVVIRITTGGYMSRVG